MEQTWTSLLVSLSASQVLLGIGKCGIIMSQLKGANLPIVKQQTVGFGSGSWGVAQTVWPNIWKQSDGKLNAILVAAKPIPIATAAIATKVTAIIAVLFFVLVRVSFGGMGLIFKLM
ncbi:MAG: hypothetical protein AAB358_03100 [Patescibacteria group bacterium]